MALQLTVEIFREKDTYMAYVPEIDVSSGGRSPDEARKNIRDAVEGFLEAARAAGTLDEILEESGFAREAGGWRGPDLVSIERMTLPQPA